VAYERSLAIERRLHDVLALIEMARYSTSDIAEKLDVSVPTVSRDVTALRERGYKIRSERGDSGWRYLLDSSSTDSAIRQKQRKVAST